MVRAVLLVLLATVQAARLAPVDELEKDLAADPMLKNMQYGMAHSIFSHSKECFTMVKCKERCYEYQECIHNFCMDECKNKMDCVDVCYGKASGLFHKLERKIKLGATQVEAKPAHLKTVQAHKVQNKDEEASHAEECIAPLFQMMGNPDLQDKARKCEHEGKFLDNVRNALQVGDEKTAKADVEQVFQQCANFSKTCAVEAAPHLVEMLRFSGAAVSKACRDEVKKMQSDEKHMKTAEDCDTKAHISEKALGALSEGNLTDACSTTEKGLEQCMGVSNACAHQTAPVFMNAAVMQAMREREMEAMEMMREQAMKQQAMLNGAPVLVIRPVIVVAGQAQGFSLPNPLSGQAQGFSLLSLAASSMPAKPLRHAMRGAKAPALLQEGTHKGPWVSRMLIELALKHA